MQLGRKLAEGIAIDREADELAAPDVERTADVRPTVEVAADLERVELPARV